MTVGKFVRIGNLLMKWGAQKLIYQWPKYITLFNKKYLILVVQLYAYDCKIFTVSFFQNNLYM